jgi:dipeptidyl-peptidase-4
MQQANANTNERRMGTRNRMKSLLSAFLLLSLCVGSLSQDRLGDMARYDRYERLRRTLSKSIVRNDFPKLKWADDGKSFSYVVEKKQYEFALAEGVSKEVPFKKEPQDTPFRRFPERGRQFDTAFSADKTLKAYTKDRNVFISKTNGSGVIQVTTEGNAEKRLKFGIASWVYGEELNVREAMWWSPDGKLLAYYGFDESKVPDFYLTLDETKIHNKLDVEPYPKAGDPNPVVDLYVYNLETKKTVKLDVGFDSGAGPDLRHYIYRVEWSPDGTELLFSRTNRKQCTMEMVAANPATGKCRVVVRESHPATWTARRTSSSGCPNATDSATCIWSSSTAPRSSR